MLRGRLVGPHGYRISASFLQSVCWLSTKQQITSLSSVAPKWKPLLLRTEFLDIAVLILYMQPSSPNSFGFPLLINHPAIVTYLPTAALEMCNSFAQAPHYHIPRLLIWGLNLWPGTWSSCSSRMHTRKDKYDEANSRLSRLQEYTLKCK